MLQIDSRRRIRLKNTWNFKGLIFGFSSLKRWCFHHFLFPLDTATLSRIDVMLRSANDILPNFLLLPTDRPLTLASISYKYI